MRATELVAVSRKYGELYQGVNCFNTKPRRFPETVSDNGPVV